MEFYTGHLYVFEDIDNRLDIFDTYYTKYDRYNIVLNHSSNFNAVCADSTASMDNGTFQITTKDGLFVIDLKNKVVSDQYTTTMKGAANETIIQEDIVDLNVSK